MKHELKISTLSVVCALLASGFSDSAFGASSVRVLGGAGSYNSVASASSGTNVARAGSVRVSPKVSANANVTTQAKQPATNAPGRAAAPQRLSLGKYLGGGKNISVSGGTTSAPSTGGTMDPSASSALVGRVERLEDTARDLSAQLTDNTRDLQDAIETKQDVLTPRDDYIEIDSKGNISLNIDNLTEDLAGINGQDGKDGVDGREVEIRTNATHIQWRLGDGAWQDLIAIADITGKDGVDGEDGTNVDLSAYPTITEMNQAIADRVAALATLELMNAALDLKANAADVYTKGEVDSLTQNVASNDKVEALSSTVESHTSTLNNLDTTIANKITAALANNGNAYVTQNDIPAQVQSDWNETDTSSAAYIANKPNMAEYATASALSSGLSDKASASDVTELQQDVASVKSALAGASETLSGFADGTTVYGALNDLKASSVSASDAQIVSQNIQNIQNLGDTISNVSGIQNDVSELTTTVNTINNNVTTLSSGLQNANGDVVYNTTNNTLDLSEGVVKNTNLAVEVKNQLVGASDSGSEYSALLVDGDGNRVWVGLEMGSQETLVENP